MSSMTLLIAAFPGDSELPHPRVEVLPGDAGEFCRFGDVIPHPVNRSSTWRAENTCRGTI